MPADTVPTCTERRIQLFIEMETSPEVRMN
jgi:hypothetical protein